MNDKFRNRRIPEAQSAPANGQPPSPPEPEVETDEQGREQVSVGLDNLVPTVLTMMEGGLKQREVITNNQVVIAKQNSEIIRLLKVIAGEDVPATPPEAAGDER